MGIFVKAKNVRREEAAFRLVIGIILIVLSFFTFGSFWWISGVIGVALILTSMFGY